MKDFHCRDAGMNCDFVARGSTAEEILEQTGRHAEQVHHMKVTPDLAEMVKGLIHDESSVDHRQSVARNS